MAKLCKQKGFSLTEVLLAIGTLAVGVLFVAGVFPVAVHLTTIAAEQTIAAIAADEAFAKVKLYAKGELANPSDDISINLLKDDELRDFNDPNVFRATQNIDPDEFTYPSVDIGILQKHYYWTALCRRVGTNSQLVQVTVFVCRRVSPNLRYYDPNDPFNEEINYPGPVRVEVSEVVGRDNELEITKVTTAGTEKTFVNDGYTIVDNETGQIYRVLERYASPDDNKVLLDRNWKGSTDGSVWVVPPPVSGGRGPCIGVYQRVIRF